VAMRLGLISPETPELGRRVHMTIEHAIPAGQRLAFHINAVAHGRQCCHLVRPECADCPVGTQCVVPERGRYSRRVPAVDKDQQGKTT